jgi:prepilin-type N-terminal cleavage/methylation domain-containing protein
MRLIRTTLRPFRRPARGNSAGPCRARRGGFTIVEVMMVLLIMSIITVLGIDAIAEFEAAQRADRAARESLAFFRLARSLALTTGKNAKVVVDPVANTVSIFWQSNGTSYDSSAYANGMTSTGTSVLNINTARDLAGTTITAPTASTFFEFSALGNCAQTGTITFFYGGHAKSLVVSNVGDPALR